jgi:hypothetical protein
MRAPVNVAGYEIAVSDKIYKALSAFGDAFEDELRDVHRELDAYNADPHGHKPPRIVVAAYTLFWCAAVAPVCAAIRTVTPKR